MALLAVRQGPHQVAQKSTNNVCPRNLEIMDGNKSSLETCPVSFTVKPVFLLFNSIFFIISFWVGSEYKNAYVCLILILIPCIVHLTQTVALEATFAKNRIRERAIVYAVGTIISTVLTCILAPEFGAIGAAIGICVAELLCYEIGMNFVYKKMLNINIRHFFVQTHLKLLPPLEPHLQPANGQYA